MKGLRKGPSSLLAMLWTHMVINPSWRSRHQSASQSPDRSLEACCHSFCGLQSQAARAQHKHQMRCFAHDGLKWPVGFEICTGHNCMIAEHMDIACTIFCHGKPRAGALAQECYITEGKSWSSHVCARLHLKTRHIQA